MTLIKTAVVGVGHLGSLHARVYSDLDGVELCGVYDHDTSRAGEIAARHETRVFTSLDQVIDSAEAVSLAVPTDQHYPIARHLLEAGIDLLVEKPITERVDQAAELVELARQRRLILQVGHVERFNPALMAAARHIEHALFVESLRIAPFNPRGTEVPVVLDLMIHDIDIILNIIGKPVREVAASGLPLVTDKVDIASARLHFEGGAVANVVASRVSMKKMRKMRFFATDRYVSVDLMNRRGVCYRKKSDADFSAVLGRGKAGVIPDMAKLVERHALKPDRKAEPLVLEISDFVECVRTRRQPLVTGEDGMRALEVAGRIMEAIEKSLAEAGLKNSSPGE